MKKIKINVGVALIFTSVIFFSTPVNAHSSKKVSPKTRPGHNVSSILDDSIQEYKEIQEAEKNVIDMMNSTHRVIFRVKTNQKVVALTFDDGPDPRFTPKILDILKKNNAKATFFVVGKSALKYPDIVQRAINEGSEIDNHTFTHPEMEKITNTQAFDEIRKNEAMLRSFFGVSSSFFRPPKGKCSNEIVESLFKNDGIRTILWTICFEHQAQPDPYKRAQELLKAIQPGYIVLAHDGRLNRTKTVKGMEYLVKWLKDKGYTFVTLNQLMALDGSEKLKQVESNLVK